MDRICTNHSRKALDYCHNCGEPFCSECLNKSVEHYYCNKEDCYNRYREEVGEEDNSPGNKVLKIGTIILSLIVVAFFGTIGKYIANEIFSPSKEIKTEISEWKTRQVSYTGLSVDTPFELDESQLELPSEYESMINDMVTYKYSSDALNVYIIYARYSDDIIPNLDGAAEGAIINMRASDGVENFTYSISIINHKELPGRKIFGNFNLKGQLAEYVGLVFAKGTQTWQVLCTFLNEQNNRKIVDKIIQSINIQ